ncbi:MAG: hypothetical protein ACOYKA_04910 [Legionellaceae bacterium]
MLKKMTVSILSTSILMIMMLHTSTAEAVSLKLAPHASKRFENTYLFALDATCTIQSTHKNNKIIFRMVEKTGCVNGKNLKKGQATSVTVNNKDAIAVHAEPGTTVNLQNTSDDIIQANCSV